MQTYRLFQPGWLKCLVVSLFILSALAGCTKAESKQTISQAPDLNTQSLTITVGGNDSIDLFNQRYADGLKKKYPNLTIQYSLFQKGSQISDLVAQGTVPDLILGGQGDIAQWKLLGVVTDLTPLMQKYKFDSKRINPDLLLSTQNASPDGKLYSLPTFSFDNVLYYNKDIFDKFGISYPKNGMTWYQVFELAKQLTRNEDGIQYRGLEPDSVARMAREYPLRYVDSGTNKSVVASDPRWKNLLDFLKQVYAIPGNLPSDVTMIGNGTDAFLKDHTVAMWTTGVGQDWYIDPVHKSVNWDMVSYPTWPDAPGLGPMAQSPVLAISSTSTHKDEAFQVMTYILSDEYQNYLSRQGYVPSITNPAILQQYGADVGAKDKNIQAPFYDKFAVIPKDISQFDFIVSGQMKQSIIDAITGKKDTNTALAEAANKIDQYVATQLQNQK